MPVDLLIAPEASTTDPFDLDLRVDLPDAPDMAASAMATALCTTAGGTVGLPCTRTCGRTCGGPTGRPCPC